MDLKGKRVTVVGLGNSGFNAAVLLKGIGARVRATDARDTPDVRKNTRILKNKDIKVETGGHTEAFLKGSRLIVLSPGVENASPAVKWAEKYGIPIIGEMELGYRFCKGRIIAITGTNGKSTVTALSGEILKDGGKDAVVCGNIGNSLCGEIGRIKKDTWVVLEVSSFQLERIEKFRPQIAAILNITDDHMDRYNKFTEYFNEKLKVFRNQTADDILILNGDAENLRALKEKAKSKVLFFSRSKFPDKINNMKLKGTHNVENILAASLVGSLAGVSESSIGQTIKNFRPLPHRFETVVAIDGVLYIDDSKGTTVDSTYRALESCDKPVILIAGGKDKNSDYGFVKEIVRKKVKHLVLIGEAAAKIKKALGGVVETHEVGGMDEAVETARRLAKKGFIVLLSPMCSSFDMFKDYKERGGVFKRAVRRL